MTFYEVELPILFKTDDIIALEELDVNVKYKLSEYAIQMATFYDISGIAPRYDANDNNREFCSVFSGGNEFIANMTYKQLQGTLRLLLYSE